MQLKIQASDIQTGDRIVAYCNNKMQICKVKHIESDLTNINLSVSTTGHHQSSSSRVVRFRRDALVDLAAELIQPLAIEEICEPSS
ncbi:hypothetical protein ACKFKG_30725 [Phormidesmis sp. 146-35]